MAMVETAKPMTSARSLFALRDFVERQQGAGSFQRLRHTLAEKHGIEMDPVLVISRWYPTEWLVTALNVAHDLWGPSDFHEQFGRSSADYQINLFMRFLLKFTTPSWVMQKGIEIWRQGHDSGVWRLERTPGRIRGSLSDFGVVDAGYCRTLMGFFRRAC